jgi:hypothetical protein
VLLHSCCQDAAFLASVFAAICKSNAGSFLKEIIALCKKGRMYEVTMLNRCMQRNQLIRHSVWFVPAEQRHNA